MKITRRQLRRIIKETLLKENTLYVNWERMYGPVFHTGAPDTSEEEREQVRAGEMIRALLAAGDDDIFDAPQGVDPKALSRLLQQDKENDQGSIENWDNTVFSDYYSVDLDRVIRLYARLMSLTIEEVSDEPEYPGEDPSGPWSQEDLDQAARDEYEFESYYS